MQANELRALRKEMDLTQGELAKALNLSTTAIGMMERGERPIEWRTEIIVSKLACEMGFLASMRETIGALEELAVEESAYRALADLTRETIKRNEEWVSKVLAGRS